LFHLVTTIIKKKTISDCSNNIRDIAWDAPDIVFIGNVFEMFRPASIVGVKELISKSPK